MRKRTRKIAALLAASALSIGALAAGPVSAAEQHPSKFGPHDNQCTGDNNQPNCPGSH
jgi:hypothetical protein